MKQVKLDEIKKILGCKNNNQLACEISRLLFLEAEYLEKGYLPNLPQDVRERLIGYRIRDARQLHGLLDSVGYFDDVHKEE